MLNAAVLLVWSQARKLRVAVPRKLALGRKRSQLVLVKSSGEPAETGPTSDQVEPSGEDSQVPFVVAVRAIPTPGPSTSVTVPAIRLLTVAPDGLVLPMSTGGRTGVPVVLSTGASFTGRGELPGAGAGEGGDGDSRRRAVHVRHRPGDQAADRCSGWVGVAEGHRGKHRRVGRVEYRAVIDRRHGQRGGRRGGA